jgi:hypothetical protein
VARPGQFALAHDSVSREQQGQRAAIKAQIDIKLKHRYTATPATPATLATSLQQLHKAMRHDNAYAGDHGLLHPTDDSAFCRSPRLIYSLTSCVWGKGDDVPTGQHPLTVGEHPLAVQVAGSARHGPEDSPYYGYRLS